MGWTWQAGLGGLAMLLLALAPVQAAERATVHVGDAWARAPLGAGNTGAAFLTLYNTGDAEARLVGADSPAARRVELHRTEMQDGVMRMRPVDAVPVPPQGHAKLRPGGLHVMLIGAAEVGVGDRVALTLQFADGTETAVELPVLKPGTTLQAVRDQALVQIRRITAEGTAERVGTLALRAHADGLLAVPLLQGLEPGPHAMHVHTEGSCDPAQADGETRAGAAAGGHYDPEGTGRYRGPYAEGARGDLPNLVVEADGTATIPVLAPRADLDEVRGRSVMIHQGADRYGPRLPGAAALTGGHGHGGSGQDHAAHGGMRMYCGVIPE
jgi:Cu-Zn family superoxide dismutase